MGLVFAIIGFIVVLAILLVAAAFWLMAMVSLIAFMLGGVLAMALFGGGQDAFYIGGALFLLASWGGMAIWGNKIDKES